jgi:hypothetical protein
MSSVLVCDLPKSAKHMLEVEFADLKIGRADERYGASMAEYFPKPFRAFYCGRGASAFNGFPSDNAAISEIERQCHEKSDFCHGSPPGFCWDDRTAIAPITPGFPDRSRASFRFSPMVFLARSSPWSRF